MALKLDWLKCGEDSHWCSLENVNLENITAQGVYIIWHEGNPSVVVRVGQGDIKARLTAHRSDAGILAYQEQGTLRVTWASVSAAQRDGVEAYLANQHLPLVGDAFPDAPLVVVNSPFA